MRIVILFDNCGPYHLARLRGVTAAIQGAEVVGLQVCAQSAEYGWQVSHETEWVETLFEEKAQRRAGFRIQQVWRHLERLQPVAVAIAGYASVEMLSALLWCRRRRRVAILLSESKAGDTIRSNGKEALKSLVIRRYHAAVVGGRPQRRYLESMGFPSEGIFTGYDTVDNTAYNPSVAGIRSRPLEQPFFLMVNRFVQKKNLPFALRCYAAYRQQLVLHKRAPWDLVLAGDGELRGLIEAEVAELNLQSVVHFPGFLQQPELVSYLRHCEVFIHASTVEQWGLVVNEAMAAGRPVIVSRKCGCFEDLIDEGRTGLGFDPTDKEELVDLMLRATLGELPLSCLGSGALRHIQNFSPLHFGRALKCAVEFGSQRISRDSVVI